MFSMVGRMWNLEGYLWESLVFREIFFFETEFFDWKWREVLF